MALRNYTKDEIIAGLREALEQYADTKNWRGRFFVNERDVCGDDCSGLYQQNGSIARNALNGFHEKTRVSC